MAESTTTTKISLRKLLGYKLFFVFVCVIFVVVEAFFWYIKIEIVCKDILLVGAEVFVAAVNNDDNMKFKNFTKILLFLFSFGFFLLLFFLV